VTLTGGVYINTPSARDDINGIELWKSDGTDAGTVMVKDINPNFEAGSDPVPLNAN